MKRLVAALGAFTTSFAVAQAADSPPVVRLDPELSAPKPDTESYDGRVTFGWFAALTSNYISDGVTQSDDKPAFQFGGEIASGIVYAGIWMSTVELDPDNWEIDLSWGIRPQFGPLTITAGYTRYIYDESGNCCGEWVVDGEVEFSEKFSAFGEIAHDPQADSSDVTGGFTLALADALDFSAEFTDDLGTHDSDWNAGVTWKIADSLSADFRYFDADIADPRFVVTLTWSGSTGK
jgi:uncharacterized protein (TIGR02001 family)